MKHTKVRDTERGQIMMFFIFVILGLGLMTAVTLEIGRIVYARGEVGKAADAAALAAASRLDVVLYRETGQVQFLPDAYAHAQTFASLNAQYLRSRGIGVVVTNIQVNAATRRVSVTVAADLSSLLPAFLPHEGVYRVAGYARSRLE